MGSEKKPELEAEKVLDKKNVDKKKGEKPPEELSAEDQELKANLELMVTRVKDSDAGVQHAALEALRSEIRQSTSSMTSVPKPLKFLRPHYETLKQVFGKWGPSPNKVLLADVLSLLAMTIATAGEDTPESLKYRLLGSGSEEMGSWGHEYVRNLAGEVGFEYNRRTTAATPIPTDDILGLARQIVPFHMKNNAEPEAVDLLIEVELVAELPELCDENNYSRTCLYLTSCASYLPEPEDRLCLEVAHKIFLKVGKFPEAMRLALRLCDTAVISHTFELCEDVQEKRQLAFMLARQDVGLDLEEGPTACPDDLDMMQEIMSNAKLSEYYLALARDMDVMEVKTAEDIYKSHLVEGRTPTGAATDSARQNLATTFVNALVNAGFGHDPLMTNTDTEGSSEVSWIFKNKDHGKMSATASLGAVLLWDVEGGLPQIDKYLYSSDNHVVAGALLAVGILNSGVRNESDPAFALLSDSVTKDDASIRIGAMQGLGLAYAGTAKEEIAELLCPVLMDDAASADVLGFAALSLGMVFVGTGHAACAETLCQALMTRPVTDLEGPLGRLTFLALGLLFLRKQAAVEATVQIVRCLQPQVAKYAEMVLEACAYCGSGNVLKVQQFLAACSEHPDHESEEYKTQGDAHQAVAVLGIALVAQSEELGSEMAVRTMEHLLQYGEPPVRRAVPLAIALLSMSDPNITVTDTLGRLSHDTDEEVAMSAVLSLGLVSAGTNNARVASQLRQLSSYYYKEPSMLFLLRCAQGLTHMGKGLLTLKPYHSDKLMQPRAMAGLLQTLFCCLDMKATILSKYHHVLFNLFAAMQPRMLMTLDEEMRPLPLAVRVGQSVDVVGQAGRPKTITGFQTRTTPVLLATGDRAELATDKYIPVSPILEGCVILKPNPDYVEPTEDAK